MKTHRIVHFLMLSAILALAAGCAEDPSITPGTNPGDRTGEDPADDDEDPGDERPDRPDTPVEGARLEPLSSLEQRLVFGDTADLQVQLIDGDNDPIADAFVSFETDDEVFTADSSVSPNRALTDADGIATVELRAGRQRADFTVTVSVVDDDSVDPIVFQVFVGPKDSADYLINVLYDGPLRFGSVQVLLYNERPRACDELPRDPDGDFPDTEWAGLNVVPTASGEFETRTVNVPPTDLPIYYAVAFAKKDGHPAGYACTTGLPAEVERGSEIPIDLVIEHLYPSVEGRYSIRNEFDLLGALPEDIEQVVRLVGDFLTDPGEGIVAILETYWSDFADLPGAVRSAVGPIVNRLIDEFAPGAVRDMFEIGSDINTIITRFTLEGDLYVVEEPGVGGRLAEDNRATLNTVMFTFRGDEFFRDLTAYGYDPIEGEWTGAVTVLEETRSYALNVESFGFTVNYGEIVLFALETLVFPQAIDPSITSLEDFFTYIIDCEAIATGASSDRTIRDIIDSVCDSAVAAGSGFARDFLLGLSTDTSNQFQLQTPADQPCPLYDLNEPADFVIDELGKEEPFAERCIWEGEFRWDTSAATGEAIDGNFFGYRGF